MVFQTVEFSIRPFGPFAERKNAFFPTPKMLICQAGGIFIVIILRKGQQEVQRWPEKTSLGSLPQETKT